MELDRVHRLLQAEYAELLDDRSPDHDSSDKLLVESPFAETTRDGRGVREVALGLTRTKLIVAADVLPARHEHYCPKWLDASIESLELLSVYPLELVTLSVFRRRRRRSLKARLVDGRTRYYELGGLLQLEARWALWCRHLRAQLEHRRLGSSLSETTAATSSSSRPSSSIPRRRPPGRCRGGAAAEEAARRGWLRKDLYLGAEYAELADGSYAAKPSGFAGASIERAKDELKDHSARKGARAQEPGLRCTKSSSDIVDCRAIAQLLNFQPAGSRSTILLDIADPEADLVSGSQTLSNCSAIQSKSDKSVERIDSSTIRIVQRLARFGFGVEENCGSALCLRACKRRDAAPPTVDPRGLAEDAVVAWENAAGDQNPSKRRHLRRYGISPSTYFLNACGPWSVQPGDRESVAKRRSHSCVAVRRQPAELELRLPVSRRQLASSVSLGDLAVCSAAATRGRLVLFWTPDYWYRPRAATEAYRQVRRHLGGLWLFRVERERREMAARGTKGRTGKRRHDARMTNNTSGCILNRLLPEHASSCSISQEAVVAPPPRSSAAAATSSTTALLRRLLRLEFRVSLWDLDSRTLACQLTLVDRELFARVPARELVSLARRRSSRDSPNLGAWVAFAHRVSCLVASELLAVGKLATRARLMARSINAAERCFEMGNFQSARSIIAGLQSPAVYRLRETWAYLKTRHATRYETLEKLCRVFRSVKIPIYCEAWARAEARAPPLMPFIGDVLARTLGLKNDDARQDGDEKQGQTLRVRGKLKLDRQEKRLRRTSGEKSFESISPKQQAFRVADWLERCQRYARSYNYPGHALAWEFLLKARYLEDRENFLASLKLEPPLS